MIQANELRIGNYVQWNNKNFKDYFFKVQDIGLQGVDYEVNHFRLYSDIKPIELTESILLKCGFEKSAWDNYSTFRNLFCSDGCIVISLEHKYIEIGDLTLDIEIKHLHQLQNLYWCLTNEELKINL